MGDDVTELDDEISFMDALASDDKRLNLRFLLATSFDGEAFKEESWEENDLAFKLNFSNKIEEPSAFFVELNFFDLGDSDSSSCM